MYKTVRHGENSLQYKILAQQEDGITNVKRRRSSRGKTAGIITIVLLLVCGVIATAVLVPLILTNDFINLTGTFQKFSVSTLRRSHSGNHVVVIAKKPHGWNVPRQSVLQSSNKSTNGTLNHTFNKTKETTIKTQVTPTTDITAHTTTPKTTVADIVTKKTTTKKVTTTLEVSGVKVTTNSPPTTEESHDANNNVGDGKEFEKISPTVTSLLQQKAVETDMINAQVSSTPESSWYQQKKWNFESPASFISWSKKRIWTNPLSTAVGGFCVVTFIVILIVILMRSLPDRRKLVQKESADLKEDKTRLLKPSARASDEE